MTRFSLGIPTAVVLFGLSASVMAQTPPQSPVATQTDAPIQAPSAPADPAAVTDAVTPPAPAPNAVPASGAAPADAPATGAGTAPPPVTAERAAEPLDEAAQPALPSAHDLSPMGMYQQADLVVKSVMILLGIACFLSWTVLFYKLVETAVAKARARKAARILTRSNSLATALAELKGRNDPAAFMVQAVAEEYRRSDAAIAPAGAEGIKERATSLVNRVEVQASSRLRRGMGVLATIGSVGPFVGLFGTVWGIMNSFIGIAETQTTNLAVVAPGIAEALFATALGLVAAIPAVVIYNHFTRVIQGYKQTLGDAGAATLRLLSRDIDFRHLEG